MEAVIRQLELDEPGSLAAALASLGRALAGAENLDFYRIARLAKNPPTSFILEATHELDGIDRQRSGIAQERDKISCVRFADGNTGNDGAASIR